MNKTKKIVRSWPTKSGKIKTVVYNYPIERYQKRGPKAKSLITRSGRIYQDRIDSLKSRMDMADSFETDRIIKFFKKKHLRLTDKSLISRLLDDKHAKMLVNAGYMIEEGIKKLGVTETEYFDASNWNNSIFTNPVTGKEYAFQFSYYDNVWIER